MSGGEITFGVITAVIAVAALVVAILNRLDDKKVAQQAKIANNTAAGALTEAQNATGLSKEANEIARGANDLVHKALIASVDPVVYEWRFKADGEGFAIGIVNNSGHAAFNVAVVIDAGHEVVLNVSEERVAALGEVVLDLKASRDKFFGESDTQMERPTTQRGIGEGSSALPSRRIPGSALRTRATITCRTPSGTPRAYVVEHMISYRQMGGATVHSEDPRAFT